LLPGLTEAISFSFKKNKPLKKITNFSDKYNELLTKEVKPINILATAADVAELADAQASGACPRKGVEVRLLSSAFAFLLAVSSLFTSESAKYSTI
jgi:hypothetical protein